MVTVRKIDRSSFFPWQLVVVKRRSICGMEPLRKSLGIQRYHWDNKMFSISYHCSRCVSTTKIEVHRSGEVHKNVDRGSHPEVEVTWEEDAKVQIHITCHCGEKIEFNRQGNSGSIHSISR